MDRFCELSGLIGLINIQKCLIENSKFIYINGIGKMRICSTIFTCDSSNFPNRSINGRFCICSFITTKTCLFINCLYFFVIVVVGDGGVVVIVIVIFFSHSSSYFIWSTEIWVLDDCLSCMMIPIIWSVSKHCLLTLFIITLWYVTIWKKIYLMGEANKRSNQKH